MAATNTRRLRSLRGFTMAELAIVVAMIGIAMAIGIPSMIDTVRVQQRNSALSLANLQLREQRALALETREPHFVRPTPDGKGIQIGKARLVGGTGSAANTCTGFTPTTTIPVNAFIVGGDTVCYTPDGNSDNDAQRDLRFTVPGQSQPSATVSVFKAGIFKWTGFSLFRFSGFAITSISVRNFAATGTSALQ